MPGDDSGLCHGLVLFGEIKKNLCGAWWQNGFPMHKTSLCAHHTKDRLGLLLPVPYSKTSSVTESVSGLWASELPKESSHFQQAKSWADLKYFSPAERVRPPALVQRAAWERWARRARCGRRVRLPGAVSGHLGTGGAAGLAETGGKTRLVTVNGTLLLVFMGLDWTLNYSVLYSAGMSRTFYSALLYFLWDFFPTRDYFHKTFYLTSCMMFE